MRYLNLLLITLFSFSALNAQIKKPVKWSHDKVKISTTEYDLVFKAKIENNWHLYSQNIVGDDGPVPTSFNFEEVKGAEIVGKTKGSGDLHKEFSDLFDMELSYYEKEATFKQRVKITAATAKIAGYLEFMTCDNTMCLPPTPVEFSFDIKGEKKAVAKKPEPAKPAPEPVATTPTNTETKPKPIAGSLFNNKKTSTKPTGNKTIAQAAPVDEFQDEPGSLLRRYTQNAGIKKPVKWGFRAEYASDTEYDLYFTGRIEKGWYVYSQYLESEDGPEPTVVTIENPRGLEKDGKAAEDGGKISSYDKLFKMNLTKFKNRFEIKQRVKVAADDSRVKGYLTFMACNDMECLPPTDVEFFMTLPAEGEVVEEVVAGDVPADESDVAITTAEITASPPTKEFGKPLAPCGEQVVFSSLWVIFILGFGGGLIALLTPCVFPMIPLTVSFFTGRMVVDKETGEKRPSKSRSQSIKDALIYGISIIVIYVALGASLPLIFGPHIMNAMSTNVYLNMIFFVLFVIFAFSFFGFFEIRLPSSWGTKTDQMADKGGLIGIFFMAFTLGIVSFSCTGPIIGTLLVEAASGGGPEVGRLALGPPVGMLGFATALALPFTLFAAFPGWLANLPKSGGWMVAVKVVLGFLELALALKFLSVADLTQHWGILKYETFMILWIAIFGLMTIYLFGFIRFPHDSPMKGLSKTRFGLGLASLLFTVYLTTGLTTNAQLGTYNSLSVLSGLAPPTHYSILKDKQEESALAEAGKVDGLYTEGCPVGLSCFKDYDKAVKYAKVVKKPIFVDFTGHGCVNCRKMEEHVWPKGKVLPFLKQDFILVSLYVDDMEKLPEPYISDFDGQKKRTIGNKWADFQAKNFNKNSQPYYVLLSHDEKLLNNPRAYTPNVEEFASFLDCGLNAYYQDCPTCQKKI